MSASHASQPADSAAAPRVVTAVLEHQVEAMLSGLRRRYFPAGRTVLSAHLTLFHAIPAAQAQLLHQTARALCQRQAPIPLALPNLMGLGRGVAVRVQAPALASLRAELARPLKPFLSAQDGQSFRPHVTLANKLSGEAARLLLAQLQAQWVPLHTHVGALAIYCYLGPHWQLEQHIPFAAGPA